MYRYNKIFLLPYASERYNYRCSFLQFCSHRSSYSLSAVVWPYHSLTHSSYAEDPQAPHEIHLVLDAGLEKKATNHWSFFFLGGRGWGLAQLTMDKY